MKENNLINKFKEFRKDFKEDIYVIVRVTRFGMRLKQVLTVKDAEERGIFEEDDDDNQEFQGKLPKKPKLNERFSYIR